MGVRYGLNRVRYTLPGQQNVDYGSWTLTSNSRVDLPKGWIFKYDLEYIINQGLSTAVNQNITLLNASFMVSPVPESGDVPTSIISCSIKKPYQNQLSNVFIGTFSYIKSAIYTG